MACLGQGGPKVEGNGRRADGEARNQNLAEETTYT